MTKSTKWLTDVTWSSQEVDVADLKMHEHNPRTITKDDYARLVKHIREEGFRVPITVDQNNRILCGHQRYRAAKELGYGKLPVMYPSRDLTEDECDAILVRDNVDYGEFDNDMLANLYEPMELAEWGVYLPDLTPSEPEEPKEATSSGLCKCPECGEEFDPKNAMVKE